MDDTFDTPFEAPPAPPSSDNGEILQAVKDVILSHMNTDDFTLVVEESEENTSTEPQSFWAKVEKKDGTPFGSRVTFWDALRLFKGSVDYARSFVEARWMTVVDEEARKVEEPSAEEPAPTPAPEDEDPLDGDSFTGRFINGVPQFKPKL